MSDCLPFPVPIYTLSATIKRLAAMCVFPAALTGCPPFSSSVAPTNGAIWPLQPIGSSNTKSGVYGFEAPSTPLPLTSKRQKPPTAYLMTFEALLDGRALQIWKVSGGIAIFSRSLKKKKPSVFLLHVHTSISSWLQNSKLSHHKCLTVPYIPCFAKTFSRAHAFMSVRFLTISEALKLTGLWFASRLTLKNSIKYLKMVLILLQQGYSDMTVIFTNPMC